MVKNLGGNKSKRGARKHTQPSNSGNTRKASQEGEIYASITNVFGNGRAEMVCMDGVKRLLVIRKKFKGRNKRDNTVAKGTWVLAGRRMWEVRCADDKEVCDLLEVYSASDMDHLKSSVAGNWQVLAGEKDKSCDEELVFEDEQTQHYTDIMNQMEVSDPAGALDWLDEDVDIDDL